MQNRVVDDIVVNNAIDYEATALAADAIGVGTFALTDTRDSKDYLVRRLADGNCWMVQNLELELADFVGKDNTNGGLTPANTDLADSGRVYWDPGKSAADKAYAIDNTISKTDQTSYFPITSFNYLGVSQTHQFQSFNQGGSSNVWDSLCSAPGDCTLPSLANNKQAEMPRSHSNLVTSDYSTDFSKGTNYNYVAISWKTGFAREQTNTGGNEYPDNDSGIFNAAYTTITSTASYIPTTRASSATGSAGRAYEQNADGTYYGNMYIGNYYNYYAATAETSTYAVGSRDEDSICPSGWRLPVDGNASTNLSMHKLINTYQIISITGTQTDDNNPQKSAYGPTTDIHKLPMTIVPSGYYTNTSGSTAIRGGHALLWSSKNVEQSQPSGSGININNVQVIPQYTEQKTVGYAIRCVSHGTETHEAEVPEDVTTCAANSICYDANGGTGDTMANTGSATFGSSKVLSAPTYTRSGYAFVGWSESKDAVQSGAYIYGPNETITVSNLSSEGMTLYAQWLAPENSSYTMQAFGRNETVKTCSNMTDGNNGTTEERIALRDERDDNVYIVTKLKDGNCWMTSNLALNLADFAGKTTGTLLTPENTDLTASREDLSTLTIEGVGAGQKYYDPGKTIESAGVGYAYWRSSNNDGWYSWPIATAGMESMVDNQSQDSVCPSGWQLPDTWAGLLRDTYALNGVDATVATDYIKTLPLSLTLSGYVGSRNAQPTKSGYGGLYWTNYTNSGARLLDTDVAFALDYQDRNAKNDGAGIYLQFHRGGYKRFAFSIRCVKR